MWSQTWKDQLWESDQRFMPKIMVMMRTEQLKKNQFSPEVWTVFKPKSGISGQLHYQGYT